MTVAPTHVHDATVLEIHDGDTLLAMVDVDFRIYHKIPIRLNGIDAPELLFPHGGGPNPAGQAAHEHLIALINNQPIILRTFKNPEDKYGRWLADVLTGAGINLCEQMILDGFALPYTGHGPKPGATK